MNLYQKYRPNTLEKVKGNEMILNSLKGLLEDKGKCPHTFLLHGGSGCGKTTIGRILAKELGSSGADFREINASDDTGIDGVREIIKNSQFMPMESDCRVWLIDEAHRWTTNAQDSILKILEDTPPHVYFILCTTEPTKLKSTIRSRCSEFQVMPLNDAEMKVLLKRIVKKEGKEVEPEIIDQIIEDSLGHPRRAIVTLEQVLNVDEDQQMAMAKKSAEMQSQSIELSRALLKPRVTWKEVSTILSQLKGQEPEDIRRSVLGYCQAVLLKSDNEKAGMIMEYFIDPFYNSGFPQLVTVCYQIVKN